MLKVGIIGRFAASLAPAIRQNLTIPCEIVVSKDGICAWLADVDVLVTMVLSQTMAGAFMRLKLVQVPGAGLDRIERSAIPSGIWLANVYGHENGIAEYVIGAIVALTRDFLRLDAALRQ
jgi:phosphoglycerate dehydrogenase-like enzyme